MVHINTEYGFDASKNHVTHPGNGPTGVIQSPAIVLGENAKIGVRLVWRQQLRSGQYEE